MSWLKSIKSKKHIDLNVGLGIHGDGLSIAVVNGVGRGKRWLSHCEFIPAQGDETQDLKLDALVRQLKIRGARVVVVMEPGSYSLLQVEAPEVEPDELRSAIRWRIKDLIDFHIDDAVFDVYDLPEPQRKGSRRLMYVVAARMGMIQQLVDRLANASLELTAIDITELALRNLVVEISPPDSSRVLLYLSQSYGLIEIIHNATLYLNRRIEINARDLEEQGGFGLDELLDALMLELQRSLDYNESQFGIGQVSEINVVAPAARKEALVGSASNNLRLPVAPLDLSALYKDLEQPEQDQINLCLPAIGAALRSH